MIVIQSILSIFLIKYREKAVEITSFSIRLQILIHNQLFGLIGSKFIVLHFQK